MQLLIPQKHNRHFSLLFAYLPVAFGLVMLCSCRQHAPVLLLNNASYNKVLDSANHLYDLGKTTEAISYLNAASPQYHNLSLPQKIEYFSLHYNYSYHIQHNNTAAYTYTDSMLHLFKLPESKRRYSTLYSKACFYKGDVSFSEARYNEAYFYFYQGKLLAAENGGQHDCMISDYSYRMGMILYKQEHYRLAAHYFKASFDEAENCQPSFKSFYRRQELLSNTGISYQKAGEPDSANIYFNQTLNFIKSEGSQYANEARLLEVARGVVYGNMASVYLGQKNFNQAKALLKKSIAINIQKGNDNNDALLSQLKLARIYDSQGLTDSLHQILIQVKPLLDSVNNLAASADWNYLMAGYYENTDSLKQAIRYYKTYNAVSDSANRQTHDLKETDISEQLRRFERDYEVDNLRKKNRDKSIYLIIALGFVITALLLVALIYKYWRQSKINVIALHGLNQQINRQNVMLENTLNDLKHSGQEKDRILRAVAHDLRNPVGGIASLSHAIVDDDDYNEEQKACLNLIKETAYNSIELINEILEATSNSHDKMNREWVDMNTLLNSSVELLRFKAAEKNQHIQLNLLDQVTEVWISREKIWRVLGNLISNAIKFSPVGAHIRVQLTNDEHEIEIAIRDEGIGIPDTLKPHVFNMFTEAKRPGTLGEKSFGLGLSICRQIIDKHNGRIWFESNADKGTTFFVRLHKMSPQAHLPLSSNASQLN